MAVKNNQTKPDSGSSEYHTENKSSKNNGSSLPRSKKKTTYDRRAVNRRLSIDPFVSPNKRSQDRRSSERRLDSGRRDTSKTEQGTSINRRSKSSGRRRALWEDYSHEFIGIRRDYLSKHTSSNLKHISSFSFNPQDTKGNIERLIGAAQIPIGISGPLRVNGEFAKGDFYVPLATTEGALVMTYQWGMQAITLSQGASVRVIEDSVHVSPIFMLNNLNECVTFRKWITENFLLIKQEAEKTTSHGKLKEIKIYPVGKKIILTFFFDTSDAAGQNIAAIATESACKFISGIMGFKYYLKSNFSSDKKASFYNYIQGYGKKVIAEVTIPNKVARRVLGITPKEFCDYYQANAKASTLAGMVGVNGHFANGLSALFIACGQDAAHISNSHMGVTTSECTEDDDLYISVYLPSLIVASVGGGTHLATQKECLEIMDCYGPGKCKKLAEIAAATALAGEIAVGSAVAKGTFADGHSKHGRRSFF